MNASRILTAAECPRELSSAPSGRAQAPWFRVVLAVFSSALLLTGCEPWAYEPPAEKAIQGPVDPDAPEEFTTTASGLQYRIRRKGTGRFPGPAEEVKVHYRGWLDDGTVFNNTYIGGAEVPLTVNRVVPGFTEGLQLVDEGGMIEMIIPSNIGYGPKQMGVIPPDSTLHFLVELLQIGPDPEE